MIVLGIETASPSGGVALIDGDRLLGSMTITNSQAHSRLILPSIDQILTESKLTLADVDAVAVSKGPGSFTGVRVGMTLGKALCHGENKPKLVLVSTLEALAYRALDVGPFDVVVPMLNAMRGEVYTAYFWYNEHEAHLVRYTDDMVLSPKDAADYYQGFNLVAGEGFLAYRDEISEVLGDRLRVARTDRMHPNAEQVAWLGRRQALAGDFADPATAAPVYLRDASTSTPKKKPPRII